MECISSRKLFAVLFLSFFLAFTNMPAHAQSPSTSETMASEPPPPAPATTSEKKKTYSKREIHEIASDFFGDTSEGLAKAIEHVFEDKGEPNGYIMGEEGSGAIGVGLRYGKGRFYLRGFEPMKVYWQGPSLGFDLGANASKVFTLVYNAPHRKSLFQRFPGVDGSLYFVAGFGVNYQQSGDIILAPIRTGVGLRAGANVGYLHYTKKKSFIPF